MKSFLHRLALVATLLWGAALPAAERIPPVPTRFFNDYAGVVSPETREALNRQLEQYERESSNQLLVAIFPRMESGSSVEDFTIRIAEAWKIGQRGRNNGAVLFAFMQEHKLYIQVGYGLEATLTDAISSQIIENELKPAFRSGDYDAGLRAAVRSMIAATKGEYKGTGRTHAEGNSSRSGPPPFWVIIAICVIGGYVILSIRRSGGATLFTNQRRTGGGIFWGGGGNSGGWSGGDSGSSSGSFSGGGGSFGGGGAGGSW